MPNNIIPGFINISPDACRKQAARDYCNDKLLRQSLRQWELSAKWSRDSGWKEDLAFHHCSETLLIKAMDSWRLVSTGTLSGPINVNRTAGALGSIMPDSLVSLLLECDLLQCQSRLPGQRA